MYGNQLNFTRNWDSPARLLTLLTLAVSTAAVIAACVVASAHAAQAVPLGAQRVQATANDSIDIDGRDDWRVDADVAVLDGGVNLDHPDLDVVAGADCVAAAWPGYACSTGPGAGDDEWGRGHGTGVAERIGAIDNGFGVGTGVGVAPGVRIWAVKVADADEVLTPLLEAMQNWAGEEPWDPTPLPLEGLIAGVRWVTDHADEVEVLHIAVPCTTDPDPEFPQFVCIDDNGQVEELEAAITEAVEAGLVVVTPSGNWQRGIAGPTADSVPARHPDLITVSAIFDSDGLPGGKGPSGAPCNDFVPKEEEDDTNADSSHYGAAIEIAAPGPCTSAAAPHVSGAAAILASMSEHPTEDGDDVEEIGEALFGGGDCAKPSAGSPDVGSGSCAWADKSPDGIQEPLLDVHDESVFDPETVEGAYPAAVDSDVNGDGRADMVTLRANGVAYVHPGGTDSKFAKEGTSSFGGSPLNVAQYDGTGHHAIDVADVDGDKRADVVTLADDGDVHVYRGGTGFGSGVTSELGTTPGLLEGGAHEPIAVADVNGDGRGDLVSYDDATNALMLYLGRADATFGPGFVAKSGISSALHTGVGHHFVDAGDVTGDGRADLVSMHSSGDLYVFAGQSSASPPGTNDGALSDPLVSHAGAVDPAMDDGQGFEPLGLGDVTGDGKADLVLIKESYVYTYPGENVDTEGGDEGSFGVAVKGTSGSSTSTTFGSSGNYEAVGVLDVDGNAKAELIIVAKANGKASAVPLQANGSFGTPVTGEALFPSTQHFKNQDSTGNEFVSEKPSWRRRGCDLNGCGWVVRSTPNVSGGPNRLTDVTCTSATFCFASGNVVAGGVSSAYGASWDGSAWKERAGVPESSGTEFSAVSCSSSTACTAVGHEVEPSGQVVNLAVRWDGSKWARQTVPSPSGGPNRLTGVTCTSATFCFATGNLTAYGVTWAYGASWDGSTWKERGGLPENSGTEFAGVSCSSSTACTAVGHEVEPNGEVLTLAARWNGSKWTRQTVPNAGGGPNRLTDVTCTSATFCFASGNLNSNNTTWAYGRSWDGSSWKTVGGAPENSGTELKGASCTSSASCTAVGHEVEPNGEVLPLVVHWSGMKRVRQETPEISGANSRKLAGVSCVFPGCSAVGSFVNGTGEWTLAEVAP